MNVWLTQDDVKAVVAEFVGSFIFIFIAAGSGITMRYMAAPTGIALLTTAVATGLALSVVITSIGHISGGHVNPAITVALWIGQRIATLLAVLYIAAQLVGGIVAGLLLKAIFSSSIWQPVHLGTTFTGLGVKSSTAILIEAILTFFLVFAVFGTAVDPRHPRVGGFGIGLTVLFGILMGGPLTGGSMNPARTFGPAVVANYWSNDYVYWVGPIVGGIIAALIYGYLLLPHEDIDIGSAPEVPGSDILPVPAPEDNPYLEEETDVLTEPPVSQVRGPHTYAPPIGATEADSALAEEEPDVVPEEQPPDE